MKVFLSAIAAFLTAFISFHATFTILDLLIRNLVGLGSADIYNFYFKGILVFALLSTILFFFFHKSFDSLNIKGLLLGAITGELLVRLLAIMWVGTWRISNSDIMINSTDVMNILAMVCLLTGFILIRGGTPNRIHTNGFTVGAILGYLLSQVIIYFLDYINHIDGHSPFMIKVQILVEFVLILVGSILGSILGKKKK